MKIGSTSGKMCWSILIFALVFLRVNVHSLSLYCKNPVMRKHFLILMCLRYSLPIWRSESLESRLTFSSDAFWERFGRVANCAFVGSCVVEKRGAGFSHGRKWSRFPSIKDDWCHKARLFLWSSHDCIAIYTVYIYIGSMIHMCWFCCRC